MRTDLAALLLVLCLGAPATAHDFWLEPRRFHLDVGEPALIELFVGHGGDRTPWGAGKSHVIAFESHSPEGRSDQYSGLAPSASIALAPLSAPGPHVIALESRSSLSTLPADRFTDYAREEGLRLAQDFRPSPRADAVRETYRRNAKTFVFAGRGAHGDDVHGDDMHVDGAVFTQPLGHALEIVPLVDPYALQDGERLPVEVRFGGEALADARIHIGRLDRPEDHHGTIATNSAGQAEIPLGREGRWFLGVAWSTPTPQDPSADFETIFASLTFGFNGGSPEATAAAPPG